MIVTYENLRIRNAVQGDASMLCQWWNDGRVMAHAGFPNGLKTNLEKVMQQIAADSDHSGRRLILEISNQPVGEMSYRNLGHRIAEIGIKICEVSRQGKGCGTRFLAMLISHLFSRGYEKIVLDTNVNNLRAQHVYEKLGFQKLCINHNSWINQLGEPQSSVDYELLPSQFIPPDHFQAFS